MTRKILSAEEWKSILSDWQASGLNQVDYCRNKNLKVKTFSNWKNKLVDKKNIAPKKVIKAKTNSKTVPNKAAVSKPSQSQSDGLLIATLPNGVDIRFTCDNEQMLVAAINTLAIIK